jgi:hypothetical protein
MRTTRNGGLFRNGELVMRDEVEDYDQEVTAARTRQLDAQNLMTSEEIFAKVADSLKVAEVKIVGGETKAGGIRMADAILRAFDTEGFFVSTNYRKLLILPRLDEGRLTIENLGSTFQKFINVIDPKIEGTSTTFSGIKGADLYGIFLTRLTTH